MQVALAFTGVGSGALVRVLAHRSVRVAGTTPGPGRNCSGFLNSSSGGEARGERKGQG